MNAELQSLSLSKFFEFIADDFFAGLLDQIADGDSSDESDTTEDLAFEDTTTEAEENDSESGSNAAGNIAKNLDTNNIPNMTKQEIIDAIPDNWKYTEHNGFVHIKDEAGKIRIRIDPPDKVT